MIIGIGIDLVEIDRVQKLLERHPARAAERLFTPGERAYCGKSGKPAQSFAARFAAKEALFKALGTGWSAGAAWHEVEVLADDVGAPRLTLHGATLRLAEGLGMRRAHVSLTHTGALAGAFVVLEGD